jgi:hypothetical protein
VSILARFKGSPAVAPGGDRGRFVPVCITDICGTLAILVVLLVWIVLEEAD